MKFAHLADCHIGGWNQPELKQLNMESFKMAIDICIKERVDFILIAGDLFNTAIPPIDLVKETTSELKKLSNNKIPCYIIPGSHDFSPSGKTMLDVLEKAGLCINVFKIEDNLLKLTQDKTGIKITGILGLAAGLDKELYKRIDFSEAESQSGYKIFMLHTTIDEFKPKNIQTEGEPVASLPRNFNYYAAGHVHYLFDKPVKNGLLVYPGPTFPNNFKELEDLEFGHICIVEDGRMERIPLKIKNVCGYYFDVNQKTPKQVEDEILASVKDVDDKIILLRLEGVLIHGSLSDIDFKNVLLRFKNAYCILKNTSKVSSAEFHEFEVEQGSVEEIESQAIEEHLDQVKTSFNQRDVFTILMNIFNDEKLEGEKGYDFEARIEKNTIKALHLDSLW